MSSYVKLPFILGDDFYWHMQWNFGPISLYFHHSQDKDFFSSDKAYYQFPTVTNRYI